MPVSRRDFLVFGTTLACSPLAMSAAANGTRPVVPTPGRPDIGRLGALVDRAVSTRNTPGIAFTLWQSGQKVFSRNAGLANIETGTRVTDTSVFRIGSLTKQFAGALILKLAAAERLSLADPAHRHLPFLARHQPFTVLELLNHTAGIRDGDYDTTSLQAPWQVEQARRIAQQEPFFDFPPGTAWLYSNANYILIGAIIEQVTGQPLADAATNLLFEPLGLHHTAFDTPGEIVAGRVSGYTAGESTDNPLQNAAYLDVSLAGAAGGMRSTASDLCRWHDALFHERALPAALTSTMTSPGRLRDGQLASTHRFSSNDQAMGETQYGVGLMLDNAGGDRSLIAGHHGGINGFASYLASALPSGLSYACLCNVDTHPGLPFRDIRRAVFADVLRPHTA